MGASEESIKRARARVREAHGRITVSPPRSFLEITDLTADEFDRVIAHAIEIKADPRAYATRLQGTQIALLFQKTSTRTRASFESGVAAMGGTALYIDWRTSNFTLAALEDEIRVLSRYVQLTMARVYSHAQLELMAQHSESPIINGLSDYSHPCQGLADYMTMREYFGDLRGLHVAYVGDGNNVCHSLLAGALRAGAEITVACPRGLEPSSVLVDSLTKQGLSLRFCNQAQDAVGEADVVYTDTWVSMGEEHMGEEKEAKLRAFQVNAELMAHAPSHALFMHCLPAHRGMEVTDDVMDSERSVVFDQAENRLFAQQALMLLLLGRS